MGGLDPAIQGGLLNASIALLWMAASAGGHDVRWRIVFLVYAA
jgi:hypothetical protein